MFQEQTIPNKGVFIFISLVAHKPGSFVEGLSSTQSLGVLPIQSPTVLQLLYLEPRSVNFFYKGPKSEYHWCLSPSHVTT